MSISSIRKALSNQFIRNVGWLSIAEFSNRIFRLGTTVTLARMFSEQDYGLMAVVFTVYEFALAFTLMKGVSSKIIQAEESEVETICNTSYWLNWLCCGLMFLLQCALAYPIAYFYNESRLILPICGVGIIYLILPISLVHSALIERENRLKVTAFGNAVQSFISNIGTIIFALSGMGVWSIVWPRIIAAPAWILITRMNHRWRPPKRISFENWREITHYGKNLLGVELLSKLRLNLDYLIVGRVLGVGALGTYYFAFNAGAGITTQVATLFMNSLFPHLCANRDTMSALKERYFKSIKFLGITVTAVVLLQSLASPFYVPVIFGEKWSSAVPLLILVCLSVVPRTLFQASSVLLNVVNKTHINLYIDIIFTGIFVLAILAAVNFGVLWVAAAVFLSHILLLPIFIGWTHRYVFSR